PMGYLGVRLIRPCLAFTKSELAKAAIDAGFAPVSDPTNTDQRFQRPRLRADRHMRGQSGVTDQQLMSLCQLSARLIDRTDQLVRASAPSMFTIYPQGYAVMAKHVLKEKGFFLIAGHILRHMAVKPYPANEDAIAHLKQRLLSNQAATLSGCEWRQDSQHSDQIIILREPDAPMESIMLSEGKGVFDNRWKINYPHQVRVEAIGHRRFAQIRRYLPQVDDWPGCMARAFWSLPVLIDANTKNLTELDRLVLDDGAIFPHLMKVRINSHVKLMSDFSMARFLGA
ncbi:MAG: ATP-binding protein, partial [Candidatus Puniceispirillales bacterium]